jgi:hypothetical protein
MKIYSSLTVCFFLFSCANVEEKTEIKSKNITLILAKKSFFNFDKTIKIVPQNDTVINVKNFSIDAISKTLSVYYNTTSKNSKLTYTEASSNKYDVFVINKNPNLPFDQLIIELSKALEKQKLLKYNLAP